MSIDRAIYRADAEHALANARLAGISGTSAERIIELCDLLDDYEGAENLHLAWADHHRPELLEHWRAQPIELHGIAARLWLIPEPGDPAMRIEKRTCPQCGNANRARRRRCLACAGRGYVLNTTEIPTAEETNP